MTENCEKFYDSMTPQMVLRGRTTMDEFHRTAI